MYVTVEEEKEDRFVMNVNTTCNAADPPGPHRWTDRGIIRWKWCCSTATQVQKHHSIPLLSLFPFLKSRPI